MRVFKCFLNLEKEENWLNHMATSGYILKSISFGHDFQRATLDHAIYRIDCRSFKRKSDYINYCTLFEDSGWKHVAGSMYSGTQYFVKVNGDPMDDIFSDQASRAGRYKRLSNFWITFAVAYMPLFMVHMNSFNLSKFINPKLSYYTPGLWERTGFSFLFSFLFETPFALIRSYGFLILPSMFFAFLIYASKAHLLYKKEEKRNQM